MASDLELLWTQTEHAWRDPTAHDAFIEACASAERLDFAGLKYRQRQDADPTDTIARQRLAQVLSAVMMLMKSGGGPEMVAGPGTRTSFSTIKVALGLALLGVFAGCWLGAQVWPLPEDGTCGGLLKGSPVCLITDAFAALSNGFVFALPLAGGLFAAGIILGRKLDALE